MTRRHMPREAMVISEEWRWRFLLIWVVVFTVLSSYALFKVVNLSNENRDALCAIHRTHLSTDKSLKLLLEKGGLDVRGVVMEIAAEEAALSDLGCDY